MKYKPIIWIFMTGRMKKGLNEIWPETNALLKKAKPIYKDLLKKVEGVSDKNPMSSNITMSFVIISIWLASERKITPEQMSWVMERALDWGGTTMSSIKNCHAVFPGLLQAEARMWTQ